MAERKSIEETKVALHDVVREMYDRIVKGDPPTMTLPVRTKTTLGLIRNSAFTSTERNKPFAMQLVLVLQSSSFVRCMLTNS